MGRGQHPWLIAPHQLTERAGPASARSYSRRRPVPLRWNRPAVRPFRSSLAQAGLGCRPAEPGLPDLAVEHRPALTRAEHPRSRPHPCAASWVFTTAVADCGFPHNRAPCPPSPRRGVMSRITNMAWWLVDQLMALGLSRSQARQKVVNGRWQLLLPGVYCTFTGPVDAMATIWAAVLYAGPGAAASHGTALWLAGAVDERPVVVDISIPATRRVRRQVGVRHSPHLGGVRFVASRCLTAQEPGRGGAARSHRHGHGRCRRRPGPSGHPATGHHGCSHFARRWPLGRVIDSERSCSMC